MTAPRLAPRGRDAVESGRAVALRRLGWLLALANAHARSAPDADGVYALKERLCRRYGRLVGEDVQRLVRECWGEDVRCAGASCRRCGGTGVFTRRLVRLERWDLGGRIFHRPVGPVWGPEWDARVTIDGYIRHDDVPWDDSLEAQLWLAFLFAPRLWWRMLRARRRHAVTWRRPMLRFQAFVFGLRLPRVLPPRRECWDCVRPFRTYDRARVRCFRCAPRGQALRPSYQTDDDLPF